MTVKICRMIFAKYRELYGKIEFAINNLDVLHRDNRMLFIRVEVEHFTVRRYVYVCCNLLQIVVFLEQNTINNHKLEDYYERYN